MNIQNKTIPKIIDIIDEHKKRGAVGDMSALCYQLVHRLLVAEEKVKEAKMACKNLLEKL